MPTPKAASKKRSLVPLSGMVLAIAMTLFSGVIQGRISNRWGPPRDLLAAAEKLRQIPAEFGDWKREASEEMGQNVIDMLECAGYMFGTYRNQQTGETVRVSVMLGPSGPMSVHTPEICYSSRDYSIKEKRHRVPLEIQGSSENFWALTFRSNNLDASMLHVYYAWNATGRWSAPEDPRFTFASDPFLYKIQLASYFSPGAEPEEDDPCCKFLKDFVPAVRSYLTKAS